jgi:hypothetical protein
VPPEPELLEPELEPDVPDPVPEPVELPVPWPVAVSVPPRLFVRAPESIPVLMPAPAALPVPLVSIGVVCISVPFALFISVVEVSPLVVPLLSSLQAASSDKAIMDTKIRFMFVFLIVVYTILTCGHKTIILPLNTKGADAPFFTVLIHSFLRQVCKFPF